MRDSSNLSRSSSEELQTRRSRIRTSRKTQQQMKTVARKEQLISKPQTKTNTEMQNSTKSPRSNSDELRIRRLRIETNRKERVHEGTLNKYTKEKRGASDQMIKEKQ